ncbi:MAG: hypothetical protein KTR32_43395 [Granulosicoccus sp.]|nr:hypothetical protein [Granulosicoccus sp.]
MSVIKRILGFVVNDFAKLFCMIGRIRSRNFSTSPGNSNKTTESRQIAQLYYRVEALSEESAVMKTERAENQAMIEVENIGFENSEKLQNAVSAAKMGATLQQLKTRYDLYDAEAELIEAVHGRSINSENMTIH